MPTVLDVACKLEDLSPARTPHAKRPEGLGALGEDRRDRGEREGRCSRPLACRRDLRSRGAGLGANHAAPALQALEHRSLLTADVRAGPDSKVQVEGAVGPEQRGPDPSVQIGDVDCRSIVATASGYSERM